MESNEKNMVKQVPDYNELNQVGNKYNKDSVEDEISLKEVVLKIQELWAYLWTKWLTILIAGIIGGVLGLTYALIKKPTYTAETTFVLEEGESGGGLGQYAGLASMIGIDLGGGGGGIFRGDNILQLYKSRRMIQETLLTIDTFSDKKQSLIERYIEFNELREGWDKKPQLKTIRFSNPTDFTRTQDSVIGEFVEAINKGVMEVSRPDKKLSIISVKVKSKDELFAKSFTDNIVSKVNAFYVNTKTKKSSENLAVLQGQADSVRKVLNESIKGVATAVDANPNSNLAFQTLRVASQRKQVDVQASIAVYEEIVKNLELAKINFRNDKPLIQVIDNPVLPLKNDRLGKGKGIVFGGVMGGFLILFYLIFKRNYKRIISE